MAKPEKVRVAAIFEPGRGVRPVWFDRQRRQYLVKETTYRWQDRVGDKPLLHFAVTDGEALYELVYSPLEGSWTLLDQQAGS
ncbi:MAG: hypothetical protein RQ723_12425 [Desulfuromonadales bacterium]|nr:hypothetical protein [Desulfuromonadales bacterium]